MGIPGGVYAIGFGMFAQGTSAYMLAGLLPQISSDLGVSLYAAGNLISVFAFSVFVGAPALAVVTNMWPKKWSMIVFQAIFIASHIAAVVHPSYDWVVVTRALAGLSYAGFLALGIVMAVSLVPPGQRGKALSIVATGISVSMIVGVPSGAVLAQLWGWKAAFFGVAGLAAVSAFLLVGVLRSPDSEVAETRSGGVAAKPVRDYRKLLSGHLWVTYSTATMISAAVLSIFAYLGTVVESYPDIPRFATPVAFAVYGVGAFLGLTLGGVLADRFPFRNLYCGLGALFVVAACLPFTSNSFHVLVSVVLGIGFSSFLVNPAFNARIFSVLGGGHRVGGALGIASYQVGVFLAPLVVGGLLALGMEVRFVGFVSAAFAALAVVAVSVDLLLSRKT